MLPPIREIWRNPQAGCSPAGELSPSAGPLAAYTLHIAPFFQKNKRGRENFFSFFQHAGILPLCPAVQDALSLFHKVWYLGCIRLRPPEADTASWRDTP